MWNPFEKKNHLPVAERTSLSPLEELISALPEDEQGEFRRLAEMYERLDQQSTAENYSREHGNLSPEQAEEVDRYFALRKKAEKLLK